MNITAAPVYILETAFPSHRGPLTAVYNALWNVGSLVAAWVTYGTFLMGNGASPLVGYADDRLVMANPISAADARLGYPNHHRLLHPGIARWLVERGREEEAMRVLVKYHANGDETDALVEHEMAEIVEAVNLDREINKNTSYLTLLKTKANRSRTLVVGDDRYLLPDPR